MKHCVIVILIFCAICHGIELPAGLRPAKAVGETERPIIPGASSSGDGHVAPPNVRTPPNLSLRSRMIAALNSNDSPTAPAVHTAENNDEATTSSAAQKPPVIFQKGSRKHRKSTNQVTATAAQQIHISEPAQKRSDHTRVVVSPPEGKNYGVNTLLQTNLVDSKGRVIKGVNSVPIRVPSSAELRNAKTSRASASQVETDAEKVVPVQFGRAERHKF